jgi:hypothetical protein
MAASKTGAIAGLQIDRLRKLSRFPLLGFSCSWCRLAERGVCGRFPERVAALVGIGFLLVAFPAMPSDVGMAAVPL